MLTVKVVYNDASKELVEELKIFDGYCFLLESYNYDFYKERKKALKIKGGCSAKEMPFVAVYEGATLIKAFYTEVEECTRDVIMSWITDYLYSHALQGQIKITKASGVNNFSYGIGYTHAGHTKTFIEGLPLRINPGMDYSFTTSNITKIDWNTKIFETKNSQYTFEFNEHSCN